MYAPVIIKETDTTAIMLYSLKKETGHDMNQPPPTYPIPREEPIELKL